MKFGSKVVLVLVFILLSYTTALGYLFIHEQAHTSIYQQYGIATVTHINIKTLQASTQILNPEDIFKCNDYCKMSQNQVEATGYHIALLIFALWLIAWFIIVALIMISEQDEDGFTPC